MKKLMLLLALVSALIMVSSSAAAVKPTLTVTPSQPQIGDYMTFVGCGFDPAGGQVYVVDNQPGNNLDSISVPASPFVGANGCFDTTNWLFTQVFESGTYRVTASQDHTKVTLRIIVP